MATTVLSPVSHSSVFASLPEHIQANQGRVARPQLGWLRPTTADTPLEEMRRRLDQDDYLYIKGLIPRSVVLQMREHYFSQYAGTSLLDPTKPFVDGIFNPTEPASAHKGIGGGSTEGEDLKRLRGAHIVHAECVQRGGDVGSVRHEPVEVRTAPGDGDPESGRGRRVVVIEPGHGSFLLLFCGAISAISASRSGFGHRRMAIGTIGTIGTGVRWQGSVFRGSDSV